MFASGTDAADLPGCWFPGFTSSKKYKAIQGQEPVAVRGSSLVIPAGIEPATYRLGICRSILLSYGTTRRHIPPSHRFAKGG